MEQLLDIYRQEVWNFYWTEYVRHLLVWSFLYIGFLLLIFNVIYSNSNPGPNKRKRRFIVNLFGICLPFLIIAGDVFKTWQALSQKEEIIFKTSRSNLKSELPEEFDPWYYDVYPHDISSLDNQLNSKDVLAELYMRVGVNTFLVQDLAPGFTDNLWRNGRPFQQVLLPVVITQDNGDSYTIRIAKELDYQSFSSEFEVEKTDYLVRSYEAYQERIAKNN